MTDHIKNELHALIPILLGSFFTAACCLYLFHLTVETPFYSIFLIGFGISGLIGFWSKKTLFFALGILLSTPVWSIYILFLS